MAVIDVGVGNRNAPAMDLAWAWVRLFNVGNDCFLWATGVRDAVSGIKALAHRKKATLGSVVFYGHGGPEGQEVGDQGISKASFGILVTRAGKLIPMPELESMQELLPHFDRRAGRIVLGGCEVGQGQTGMALSSGMKNIPVIAYTAKQNPAVAGSEGVEITYLNGRIANQRPAPGLVNRIAGLKGAALVKSGF